MFSEKGRLVTINAVVAYYPVLLRYTLTRHG